MKVAIYSTQVALVLFLTGCGSTKSQTEAPTSTFEGRLVDYSRGGITIHPIDSRFKPSVFDLAKVELTEPSEFSGITVSVAVDRHRDQWQQPNQEIVFEYDPYKMPRTIDNGVLLFAASMKNIEFQVENWKNH